MMVLPPRSLIPTPPPTVTVSGHSLIYTEADLDRRFAT